MNEPFLPEELAAWSGGAWEGAPRAAVAVAHDTRRLVPGALFVALRGERFDGHDFVAEALARGAAAAMVARDWPAPRGLGPLLRVEDTRRALSALARGHRRRLPGRILAVTGSLGKTTAKEMTAAVLETAGAVARTLGNWNNDIGLPLSLLAMRPSDAFGVFEAGMNHPGELAPLCAVLRPDWAVVTRIGPVHIEFFPDERAIAEEKAEVLKALPRDGVAILAADEPWFDLLRERTAARVVTIAMDAPADYSGRVAGDGTDGILVRERCGREYAYALPQPGAPMRANALRAIAVGRELEIAPDEIARALRRFTPPPMRWETSRHNGVLWINDAYNASPPSMAAALRTFAELPGPRRRWLVLGGMRELGDRAAAEHAALGERVAAGEWAGLVTVGELGAAIARAALAAGWPADRAASFPDAAGAAAYLRERLAPGDAVLLKGSRRERVEAVWEAARADAPEKE